MFNVNLPEPSVVDAPQLQVRQSSVLPIVEVSPPTEAQPSVVNSVDTSAFNANQAAITALSNMASNILKPSLDKARQKAATEGALSVIKTGSVEDVVRQQPSWTKLFGDSASVQGARAFKALSNYDKVTNDILGNMEQYQEMDTATFSKKVMEKLDSIGEADAETKTLTQGKLLENMSTLIKAQTAANLKWQQVETYNGRVSAAKSALDQFDLLRKRSVETETVTDVQVNESLVNALKVLAPTGGMSKDAYKSMLKDTVQHSLGTGNFVMARAILDTNTGLGSQFDSEDRLALLDQYRRVEANFISDNSAEYTQVLSNLQLKVQFEGLQPDVLAKIIKETNQLFIKRYGTSKALLSDNEAIQLANSNMSTLVSKKREKEAKIAKEQEERERLAKFQTMADMGIPALALSEDKDAYTHYFATRQVPRLFSENPNVSSAAAQSIVMYARNNNGRVPDYVSASLSAGTSSSTPDEAWLQSVKAYDVLKRTPNSYPVLLEIFGKEGLRKLDVWNAQMRKQADPASAWAVVLTSKPIDAPPADVKRVKKLLEDRVLGYDALTDSGKRLMLADYTKNFTQIEGINNYSDAQLIRTLTAMRTTGVPSGKFYLPPVFAPQDVGAQNSEQLGLMVQEVARRKAAGLPVTVADPDLLPSKARRILGDWGNVSDVVVWHAVNNKGAPAYYLSITVNDGGDVKSDTVEVTKDELKAYYNNVVVSDRAWFSKMKALMNKTSVPNYLPKTGNALLNK